MSKQLTGALAGNGGAFVYLSHVGSRFLVTDLL